MAQYRRIMSRAKGKAFVDDDGRDVGIDHRGAEGVFEASDEHRLVDEASSGRRSLRHSAPDPANRAGRPVTIRTSK